MPGLPFTFNEIREKLSPGGGASPVANKNPQEFLANSIDKLKERLTTADGLVDTGLAIHPVTRYTDMTSKFFGGPGLQEGFKEGVTMKDDNVTLPPMPF